MTEARGREAACAEVPGPPGLRPLLLGHGWSPEEGGINRYLADLVAALWSAGVAAKALVPGPAPATPVGVEVAPRDARRLPVRLWAFTRAARRLSASCDVVDAHFALYALAPLVMPPRVRAPLVVHFQGPWADESRIEGERAWRVLAKRLVERAVYRRARELVVLSSAFKRTLVEGYGVAPWDVSVVPPGVDLVRFRPGDRAAARARLDLPPGTGVVVSVRRLVARTGLEVLMEAWARGGARGGRDLLVIVGDGPARPALEATARRLGIDARVRFTGRVSEEDLVDLYRAADLCAVPSVALEGFGLVVLEALACGTPVVATDVGGLPAALAGLDASLVVPARDPDALAARIARARGGDVPAAAACRAHAERFGWPAVAARHHEIYARAAGRPRRRRLRVVYLDHCARISGGEVALARLLPELARVEPHVILAEDGPLVPRLQNAGVSVEVLPMAEPARGLAKDRVGRAGAAGSAAAAAGYTVRLARRLRRLAPDLVHTNSLKAALYGGMAARLAGQPVIWHVHDRIAPDYLPRAAVRLVRAAASRLPHGIIANSGATLATLGPLARPARVIPPPLGADAFARQPRSEDHRGALRVGVVARLARWKGQDLFLRAFASAFPDGRETARVIGDATFGDEGYARELEVLTQRLGLGDRVTFTGFRHDVGAELADMDVLAHAAVIPEPFGLAVVEGLAAGLAVVAPAAGGPAEVIEDGVTGLLYPPGDRAALASALRRVAEDEHLRRRLGAAGRRRARAYTAAALAPAVLDLYREVLSSRGARANPGRAGPPA